MYGYGLTRNLIHTGRLQDLPERHPHSDELDDGQQAVLVDLRGESSRGLCRVAG